GSHVQSLLRCAGPIYRTGPRRLLELPRLLRGDSGRFSPLRRRRGQVDATGLLPGRWQRPAAARAARSADPAPTGSLAGPKSGALAGMASLPARAGDDVFARALGRLNHSRLSRRCRGDLAEGRRSHPPESRYRDRGLWVYAPGALRPAYAFRRWAAFAC